MTRYGSGIARGDDQPYQIGDEIEIVTVGGVSEVSLHPTGDALVILATVFICVAIFVALAIYYWKRSRAWLPLPAVVTTSRPKRVRVTSTPFPRRRRNSRIDVLEYGHSIDYEAIDGNPDAGSFLALRAAHGVIPQMNDVLDLWSVDIQGPPFAVRRPSDGTWWLGSDSY